MERKLVLVFAVFACAALQWTAANSVRKMESGSSMVVRSRRALRRQKRSLKSTMTKMHVKSVVKSRFAKVKIETEMENSEDRAKEMIFSVRLPESAFISGFTMVVDGLEFVGKVKEKQLAATEYQGARERGNSAGLVTADVRQTQTFNVAANVPARSSVRFTLVYQELLNRKLGKYKHSLFLNPGKIVNKLSVDVYVTEQTGITKLETQHPQHAGNDFERKVSRGYDDNGEVVIDTAIRRSKHQALVTFKPSQTQQRRLLMIPEDDRKVTVIYDVKREVLGGEIHARDGYFVHFFAPDNLPVLPKSVVFVIDRSGSMMGTKIQHTKDAFETVLREMSESDEFNIVTFSASSSVWKADVMVKVTNDSVNHAIQHVKSMSATGGTDLNQGLLEASRLLSQSTRDDRTLSAIIVLTDGDPTAGVTDERRIRQNVKRSIDGRFSLFCLGFGDDLNHDFLKKLANDNNGISRKIYSDSDAHLQLQGFFREVATPLLLNVRMMYSGVNVNKVSKTTIDKYFGGSEVIVVGKMEHQSKVEAQINGANKDGEVQYAVTSNEVSEDYIHSQEDAGDFSNVIERIWAYSTIKGLLEKKVLAETTAERQGHIDEALRLALKFGFVTPLTSMVVVTHDDDVTTTAASSTITPIPTCWDRGSDLANNTLRAAIWCPYIFEETTSRCNNMRERPTSSMIVSNQHIPLPRRSRLKSLLGRRIHASSHARHRYLSRYGSSRSYLFPSRHSYRHSLRYRPIRPPMMKPRLSIPIDGPVLSNHCGGRFTRSDYTITLPSSLADHHHGQVYCDWTITTRPGSWIDLHIEEMQTKDTEVQITSNGETIYTHSSGQDLYKFISVASNRLNIRMTINVRKNNKEVIRITYKEFVPAEGISSGTSERPLESNLQPSTTKCGMTILPRDGNSGQITSPNYPSRHPPRVRCIWNITNDDPNNLILTLDLVDIDIETDAARNCSYDKLMIRQKGMDTNICGQQNGAIEVRSPSLLIVFVSDDLMEGSGFKIRYNFIRRSPIDDLA